MGPQRGKVLDPLFKTAPYSRLRTELNIKGMSGKTHWSKLPWEIVEEILVRCPVKSLLRFMCVSKSWYLAITSNRFNHALITYKTNARFDHFLFVGKHHLNCSSLEHVFVVSRDKLCIDDKNFQIQLPTTYAISTNVTTTTDDFNDLISLLGICNGVVCLYKHVLSYGSDSYILWNPAIKKYLRVPSPCIIPQRKTDLGVGFWRDENTSDYKLIRVVNCPPIFAEIYELKKDAWRVINSATKGWCLNGVAIWLNGALHWLGWRNDEDYWTQIVIAFDVVKETFKEIELHSKMKGFNSFLGVLGGYLCVGFRNKNVQEIWLMKEYGVVSSWTKQYNLNGSMLVIGMTKDEKRLLVFFGKNKLMEYDPETCFTSVIQHFPNWPHFACDRYVETLTLLNGLQQR